MIKKLLVFCCLSACFFVYSSEQPFTTTNCYTLVQEYNTLRNNLLSETYNNAGSLYYNLTYEANQIAQADSQLDIAKGNVGEGDGTASALQSLGWAQQNLYDIQMHLYQIRGNFVTTAQSFPPMSNVICSPCESGSSSSSNSCCDVVQQIRSITQSMNDYLNNIDHMVTAIEAQLNFTLGPLLENIDANLHNFTNSQWPEFYLDFETLLDIPTTLSDIFSQLEMTNAWLNDIIGFNYSLFKSVVQLQSVINYQISDSGEVQAVTLGGTSADGILSAINQNIANQMQMISTLTKYQKFILQSIYSTTNYISDVSLSVNNFRTNLLWFLNSKAEYFYDVSGNSGTLNSASPSLLSSAYMRAYRSGGKTLYTADNINLMGGNTIYDWMVGSTYYPAMYLNSINNLLYDKLVANPNISTNSYTNSVDMAWTNAFYSYVNHTTNILEVLTLNATNHFSLFKNVVMGKSVLEGYNSSYGKYYDYLTNYYLNVAQGDASPNPELYTKTNWFDRVEMLLASMVFVEGDTNSLKKAEIKIEDFSDITEAIEAYPDSQQDIHNNLTDAKDSLIDLFTDFATAMEGVSKPSQIKVVEFGEGGSGFTIEADTSDFGVFPDACRTCTSLLYYVTFVYLLLRFLFWAGRSLLWHGTLIYKFLVSVFGR